MAECASPTPLESLIPDVLFVPNEIEVLDRLHDSAAVRPSVQHDEAGIDLHAKLVDYTELEIARALARHSVEIGLPKHYAPNHVVTGTGLKVSS